MRRAAKLGLLTTASLVGLPLLAFAGYDLFAFQSRRDEIRAIARQATVEESALPPQVFALLKASWQGGAPTFIVTRHLMRDLQVPSIGTGMPAWRVTAALWEACVRLHLPEQEQLSIIASRSCLGHGHCGYSAAAQALYGRPLSALSQE